VGQASDSHVRIDQFGYRGGAEKTVVLRQAVVGWDAPDSFSPGGSVEIRRPDSSVAYTAAVMSWNGGSVHVDSGDRVWWCDFSGLTENGLFVAVDVVSGASSEPFVVGDAVYDGVLVQAVRMYYYQRCGMAKSTPFADGDWTDSACHIGADQDSDCLSVLNPVPATSRDVSGGWHDAGNYAKYVNFTDDAVHPLLSAYSARPAAWGDDTAIPESGNGVPDILDEVAYELRWLLAMQESDGSVLHKKGVTGFQSASPPSADGAARRYAPPTASATIATAGALAHGARVFQSLSGAANAAFALQLLDGAELAWGWLEANPAAIPSAYNNAGFADVSAEDPADWQQMNRLRAAVHLFGATSDTTYRDWFDANVASAHLLQWQFALVWEQELNEALLEYGEIPGATVSVAANIRSIFAASVSSGAHLGQVTAGTDAYRAWLSSADTGWGSNRTRCLEALMFVNMNRYGLDPANAPLFEAAAEDTLHSMHGVNPPGLTYLTHMGEFGAGSSVNETYHEWFAHGSDWDNAAFSLYGPAPGILTGGPNPGFAPDPSYNGPALIPPQGQPPLKSYRDWNTSFPENSWEVTECHIPYQAAYVQLLSWFTSELTWSDVGCALPGTSGPPLLSGLGSLVGGSNGSLELTAAAPAALAALFVSTQSQPVPFKGGTLKAFPFVTPLVFTTDVDGSTSFPYVIPVGIPGGVVITAQIAVSDGGAVAGVALSNGIQGHTP
jgi:hypothetical protein